MPESFDCPNCGAPIELGDDPPASRRCPHCGTTVIVPERLRRRPDPSPLVIRIDSTVRAQGADPRIGRVVGIVVVATVLLAIGTITVGMIGGIGAAVAPFAVPALLSRAASEATPTPQFSFGGEGIGPGRFTDARSIGLDGQGRIYVGEYQGGRIQVFTREGEFLNQWFADREMPLRGMAVRRDGTLYTVQRGEILQRNGMTGERLGEIAYEPGAHFDDVTLLADGGLLAAWHLFQDDLVLFDREGGWVRTVPQAVSGQTGRSELGMRVAADGRGDLLALGLFNDAVFRYDAQGRFLNRFGSEGDEPGQLQAPLSLAVDGQGRVYVGHLWGVEVFDLDGRFLRRLEVDGPPFGLTFDADGGLWIVNGTRVMSFPNAAD